MQLQTLQPEQYEALARTDSPVLILQGAAGSGKSIVGLQRIEFVLSPHSSLVSLSRPTKDRIVMFGPSRAFLSYVSQLLPQMDVHGISQTTVTQWLLGKFSSRVTLKGGEERVFSDLMNNRREIQRSPDRGPQVQGRSEDDAPSRRLRARTHQDVQAKHPAAGRQPL